jgi:general secretion pathway protein H
MLPAILPPRRAKRITPARLAWRAGFTLLELLVVLVIVGIMLGVATLNALPSERQVLQEEARRIALLMQLARDEALVRSRPMALELDDNGYRFLIKDEGQWRGFGSDAQLRERSFQQAPVRIALDPSDQASGPMRVVFGREAIDKPFVLTLRVGEKTSVAIRADGIGNYIVE